MRHGKRFNHLGRKPAHRKATLSNMASSLILHKRITTTVAKAKALRKYVEPIITRSKDDTTHSRRMVFRYLQSKESVKELFGDIAEKVATRPGGYTRIIRVGNRLGDNAEMCVMELVDYNELLLDDTQTKAKTRRGRRKKPGTESDVEATTESAVEDAVVEEAVEEKVEASSEEVVDVAPENVEVAENVTEVVEEAVPEVVETVDDVQGEPEAVEEVTEVTEEVVPEVVETAQSEPEPETIAEVDDVPVEEVEAKGEEQATDETTSSEEGGGDPDEEEKEKE